MCKDTEAVNRYGVQERWFYICKIEVLITLIWNTVTYNDIGYWFEENSLSPREEEITFFFQSDKIVLRRACTDVEKRMYGVEDITRTRISILKKKGGYSCDVGNFQKETIRDSRRIYGPKSLRSIVFLIKSER